MAPSDLGEFELIARLAGHLRAPLPAEVVGIGDDCAGLPMADGFQLLTCDIAVAGRHFLPGVTPMADVGWRTATANVSDVTACGGRPQWALISLGLPGGTAPETLDALYGGLAEAAATYGFHIVGGNVSGAAELIVDLFMVGHTPRFIARGGARPGNLIAVSGNLGDAEAGRLVLREGASTAAEEALLRRHLRPRARQDLVPLLQEVATAAIDISDGLAPELGHLAERSGARMAVEGARVPVSTALREWAAARGEDPLQRALYGGEEYQLLFTLAPADAARLAGTDITVVGEVQPGTGVIVDGAPVAPGGWDHLRPQP